VDSILNRRDFIKAIGSGAVSLATPGFVPGSGSAASKNNKQPNIILIMSDDVSPDGGFDEYGQTTDVAIAYSKIDITNMKVEVYGLENGELSDYAWFEIDFKKQKK